MNTEPTKIYYFTNSEGRRIGFRGDATIADLLKAGVTDITLGNIKPTPTVFVHDPKDPKAAGNS